MKTYRETFEQLKSKGEKAIIPFTLIGDPDFATSLDIVRAMVRGGADILELGIPFSDPIADGATIQAAGLRSTASGMNTDAAFDFIRQMRRFIDIPIGLLVYYNLIYQRGIDKFYGEARDSGVNSVLVADLPVEESKKVLAGARRHGVETVYIVSPLTGDARLKKIVKATTGFIYIVSRLGVTGAREDLQRSTLELIERVRPQTDLPICVGFGISKPEHVSSVLVAGADGAIVGSALVKIIEENLADKNKMVWRIEQFVREMKGATAAIGDPI